MKVSKLNKCRVCSSQEGLQAQFDISAEAAYGCGDMLAGAEYARLARLAEEDDYEAFEEYRDHGRVLSEEERAVERENDRHERNR